PLGAPPDVFGRHRLRDLSAPRPRDEMDRLLLSLYHLMWAENLMAGGQTEEAVGKYRAAADYGAFSKLVLTNIGAASASHGLFKEAEAFLQAALAIDPNFGPARLNLELVRQQLHARPAQPKP
ncbi:MAG: hypothetical protein KAX19_12240, partial [Candidatus Brocadiae bacterium]|nr:hypothetical protein [Candidatus Brocadiia bacterium]